MVATAASRADIEAGNDDPAFAHRRRQVLDVDLGTGDGQRGGQALLELADVERPAMREECAAAARESVRGGRRVVAADQRGREQAQVLEAVAQRRQAQLVAAQAGVEVAAELAAPSAASSTGGWWRRRRARRRIGRGASGKICFSCRTRRSAACDGQRQLGDLVEEEACRARRRDQPGRSSAPRRRPAAAEELALDEVRREGRSSRHQRAVAPGERVDDAGDALLAGARLPRTSTGMGRRAPCATVELVIRASGFSVRSASGRSAAAGRSKPEPRPRGAT
jgi:hypothetical protein